MIKNESLFENIAFSLHKEPNIKFISHFKQKSLTQEVVFVSEFDYQNYKILMKTLEKLNKKYSSTLVITQDLDIQLELVLTKSYKDDIFDKKFEIEKQYHINEKTTQ